MDLKSVNPCDNCAIDDKIYECCGRFPETGESALLEIAPSRKIFACPHLDTSGKCGIYDNRPLACQVHFCFQYETSRAMGPVFEGFKHPINLRGDDEPL